LEINEFFLKNNCARIKNAIVNISATTFSSGTSDNYLIFYRLIAAFQYLKGPTRKMERGFYKCV